ncbi:MAG: LysM peptidoglycan-binding domain-containing protein, partial [Bdellovibrionales bacterium]|nr:LysM peptidoglycan-binding domain-containing protein [Bdellovibrionales bacterium]NQZ19232.1 LysM peptidoglycan-binding domain-containing protein [Bdellovibrionales bacterium]
MKFAIVFSALVLASNGALAVDSNFERRMHDIYKSSYSLEVPDQEWANFVEKIEDNTYAVKPGDTLWSLSKVFFGDGFFWSKIWSYNGPLTNPHMISVGSQVQFFSGSVNLPPSMDVNGQNMNKGTINISRPGGEGDLYPGAPDLPETIQELTPVLDQIPPAFRAKQNYAGTNQFDSQGMSF